MGETRRIVLQQPSTCERCGAQLNPGDLAEVAVPKGQLICVQCAVAGETPMPTPLLGRPGGSAAREYHRRRRNDREQARRELPVRLAVIAFAGFLGYFVVQLVAHSLNGTARTQAPGHHIRPPLPSSTAHGLGVLAAFVVAGVVAGKLWGRRQSTEAWARGAKGEQAVGARLGKVPGVTVLHDRRIPGGTANIDHIAIGPSGVFVIDTKSVAKGRVAARKVGPIWNRGPTQLFVGGRNRTSFVEGLGRQLEAVSWALQGVPEAMGVPIRPMVVIVGAEWGLLAQAFEVQGVWVGWPRAAAKRVGRKGPVSDEVRHRLTEVLLDQLPMA